MQRAAAAGATTRDEAQDAPAVTPVSDDDSVLATNGTNTSAIAGLGAALAAAGAGTVIVTRRRRQPFGTGN